MCIIKFEMIILFSDNYATILSILQAYLSLNKREPQPQAASFENLNTTNIFFLSYAGVSFK